MTFQKKAIRQDFSLKMFFMVKLPSITRTYTVICAFNNIYKFYDSTAFHFKMLQKNSGKSSRWRNFKPPAPLIVVYSWKKLLVTDFSICFLPYRCDSRPYASSNLPLVFHHRHQASYCISELDQTLRSQALWRE